MSCWVFCRTICEVRLDKCVVVAILVYMKKMFHKNQVVPMNRGSVRSRFESGATCINIVPTKSHSRQVKVMAYLRVGVPGSNLGGTTNSAGRHPGREVATTRSGAIRNRWLNMFAPYRASLWNPFSSGLIVSPLISAVADVWYLRKECSQFPWSSVRYHLKCRLRLLGATCRRQWYWWKYECEET